MYTPDERTSLLTPSRPTKGSGDLVDFDGPDDPYNPMNWPLAKKTLITTLYGLATLSATWASAA